MAKDPRKTPDADQVSEYLRQHPDFFVTRSDILCDLQLPHTTGNAVSLIQRQVTLLREHNLELRHRLGQLLENAQENDKLFERTRRLILRLVSATTLDELVDALLKNLKKEFNIHYATLLLFDQRGDCEQVIYMPLREANDIMPDLLTSKRAQCGQFSQQYYQATFPEFSEHVGSAAYVPLINDRLFGLLAIGSRDPDHYRSSMGTLFLGYIGDILNRLMPKLLSTKSHLSTTSSTVRSDG